jgi:hypothetical protein
MPRIDRRVVRTSLALLTALAALLLPAGAASAQSRQLPAPVPATQFEAAMRDAGLGPTVRERGLQLHEEYFTRFRDFETREVDAALDASARDFSIARSADDARRIADIRRRLLLRAAQIDGQLVDELASGLDAGDALRAERVRNALARRRTASLMPSFGSGSAEASFDLQSVPALAALDADARALVAPALDAYDAELTRLAERLANALIQRPVRAAEIREELGVASAPDADGVADEERGRKWFESIREVQRRAGEDTASELARMRRLHRDTAEQIAALVTPVVAHRLRTEVLRKGCGVMLEKSEFDAVLATVESMRASGKLDDAAFSAAMSVVEGHVASARGAFDELAAAAERLAALQTDPGLIVIGDEDTETTPEQGTMERAKERLRALDEAAAASLRLAVGLDAPAPQRADRDIAMPGGRIAIEGGAIETNVVIGVAGVEGEPVFLSGDDLGDAGVIFGGFGGDSMRIVSPMRGAELDALARKSGLDGDLRSVFDGIVAKANEERTAAEAEHKPGGASVSSGGGFTITIGEGGAIGAPDPEETRKLAEAVDAIEERLFDSLKAASATDRSGVIEAARRMRARTRLSFGESAAISADLAAIAESSELGAGSAAAIAPTVTRWDEGSVDALRALRAEMTTLRGERDALMKQAFSEIETVSEDGSRSVQQSFSVDPELSERLQAVERRIESARKRFVDAKKGTLDEMIAAASDPSEQRRLRRGYLRATEPDVYRIARDLEPFFERALRAVGDDAATREAIGVFRAEWVEAREARCEEFLATRDKDAADLASDPARAMAGMQARMRDRRRLRGDLDQIEATTHRKLVEFVSAAAGPERAAEIGELPKPEPARMPFRIGG